MAYELIEVRVEAEKVGIITLNRPKALNALNTQVMGEVVAALQAFEADTGIAASDYRFRLRSLCLLAAQCGIANMNNAIDALEQQETDDEESNTP